MILINNYVSALPDSDADALTYEYQAWVFAKDGFLNLQNNYTGIDSRFISWIIAIPYSLFGRSA